MNTTEFERVLAADLHTSAQRIGTIAGERGLTAWAISNLVCELIAEATSGTAADKRATPERVLMMAAWRFASLDQLETGEDPDV